MSKMEWNSDLVREASEGENACRVAIGRTAAIADYLIERVKAKQVNLCQSQGDAWVTIDRDITIGRAESVGFSRHSQQVEAVFEGWPNG